MKHRTSIFIVLAISLLATSCVKEKLENTYNNQEDKIDQYIEKNRYKKSTVKVPARDPETGEIKLDGDGQPVMKDSTVTDTMRVVYNQGSARLVIKEGEGEELRSNGSVAFYYAAYTFTNSISSSNMFSTNHLETASSAGWTLSDENDDILTINLETYELISGLKNGLVGVRSGEECQIFFSGKYGFGKKGIGIVPATSALVYKIWVESISNE